MRLLRVEYRAECFWALLDADSANLQRIRGPFAEWAGEYASRGIAALALDKVGIALAQCRILPPLEPGARVFGVGLNYLSHLQHLGSTAPEHPLGYIKPESALVGASDDIQYPALTAQLDYEVELVAVIARALGDEPCASACLLGYTCGNDISARDAGKRIGRLDLLTQKAMDRTTPVGPWVVTVDEIGVGQPHLDIELSVNDERRQFDNTRQMLFPIDELLNYVDARITLQPGDLVFTGSTHGVGLEDGRFLQPGDRVEVRIEGIGSMSNRVSQPRVLTTARSVGRLGQPVSP
ncbi:hydrolase [Pseudomonas sp. Bc-h]|jgi:2-keto-4-pentenoate hydratase/2-oxohepta-3-ene-1,7-dioic acid hydratase in catechol pathway|uniref:fumarylacetoacetate hydrolase family protein n=1 Tax=Pseudomonas sp. Bc-h TaxID=1943632 RepID=UPI0009DA8852|nr:fumarylacetoacetate hydrolase family protein [Pseudomonas sp. Bc-h]OQR36660.1 hydrolase [Pseudomonas sp. Bc-h]